MFFFLFFRIYSLLGHCPMIEISTTIPCPSQWLLFSQLFLPLRLGVLRTTVTDFRVVDKCIYAVQGQSGGVKILWEKLPPAVCLLS
jgi:hypothetical protein